MAKSVDQVRDKLLSVADDLLDRATAKDAGMGALNFSEKIKAVETAIAAFNAATAPRSIDPPPIGGRLPAPVDPPPIGGKQGTT
jgi:hypothetical protein